MDKIDIELGVIDRGSLSEQIVARILDMIKDYKLRPGDRLPPERVLADQMGVSRTSLREALKVLAIMKIITHRQGSGTYITSLEPQLLITYFDFVVSLDDSTYHALFEARKTIETGIAEITAQRITDKEIQELEKWQQHSIKSIDDNEEFLKADLEMHDLICEASGNFILQKIMASLVKLGIQSRRRTGQSEEIRKQVIIDHNKIIKALEEKDSIAAHQAMLDHLNFVEKGLRAFISTEKPSDTSIGEV